ncbi:MAG: RNA polymerase sigma factor [bacterium]|nr:RNA polymerase sigma factor [bacterium]
MNQRSRSIELAKLLNQTSWATRLAQTLVGPEDADDLLQEAWVQTLTHPPQQAIESPRAWLATILRRGASKERRSAGRRADRERRAAREEAQPSAHTLRAREEDRRILVKAVLNLPDDLREPLVLRYFDGLTPSVIAERLNMPASTVRSRLKRGLSTLREQLERERGEDWRAWCLGLTPAGFDSATKTASATLVPMILVVGAVIASWFGLRSFGLMSSSDSKTELTAFAPDPALDDNERGRVLVPALSTDADRKTVAPNAKPPSDYLPVTPEICVYVVRGLCLDESKKPVAGVRVGSADVFAIPSMAPSFSTFSGVDGRFVLPIGPWSSDSVSASPDFIFLSFESDGFLADTQQVKLEAEREIDVGCVQMIHAPFSIRGRVLTAEGFSAQGARLCLMRDFEVDEDRADLFRAAIATSTMIRIGSIGFIETDAEGHFCFQAVPDRPVRLGVYCNGHDGLLSDPIRPGDEKQIDLGDLKLKACVPDRSVRGRVVQEGGGSVRSTWVMASFSLDGGDSYSRGAPITIGADGQFCVPVPSGASCEFRVLTPGKTVRLKKAGDVPAGTTDLILTLEPIPEPKPLRSFSDEMPRIYGRVVHDGKGLAGAKITSWGIAGGKTGEDATHHGSAQSGVDGRFEIAASHLPLRRLEATFGPWQDPLIGEWGPVESTGIVSDVELTLGAPGSVVGEIVAPSIGPMIGTVVRAESVGRKYRTATVGEANDFRFDQLLPGRWRLVHEAMARKKDGAQEALYVEVKSGVTTRTKIDLEGELPCQLVGSFLIDGEHPPGDWKLYLTVDGRHVHAPPLRAGGVFRVSPLQRGRLNWAAISYGTSTQIFHRKLDLNAGENRLDVDVPVGCLELTNLPLPDEVDYGGDVDSPCCLTWTGPDGIGWFAYLFKANHGALTLKTVPAGTIQLRYRPKHSRDLPEEAPVVAEIEVRAGETAKLAFPPR